jgi:phosphoglycerol transferase MdoB-like AlkP superfamily enzyme
MHYLAMNWGWFLLATVIEVLLYVGIWTYEVYKSDIPDLPDAKVIATLTLLKLVGDLTGILFLIGVVANFIGK